MGDPARKARKPPPPPPPAPSRTAITATEARKQKKDANRQKALFRGFVRYLERPAASVRAIWDTERISDDDDAPLIRDCVTHQWFSEYAGRLRWKKRREEHWNEVRSRVQDHLMTQHVQRELSEIGVLEGLKDSVLPHIMGGEDGDGEPIKQARPKSLEGAVDAFIKLDRRIGQKRGHVIEETGRASKGDLHYVGQGDNPALADERGGPAVLADTGGYSDDEIAAMAEALAEKRVEVQNAKFRDTQPPPGITQVDGTEAQIDDTRQDPPSG